MEKEDYGETKIALWKGAIDKYSMNSKKEYPSIVEMLKSWEESIKKKDAVGTIASKDLPPYFMTLTEAVKFLRDVGFCVKIMTGEDVSDYTVEYWEAIIEENSNGQ